MNEDKITELVIRITSELASLNANMKSVLDKLSSHEQRISALEQGKLSLKDSVVALLVKCLVISVVTIASLSGAAGLVAKIMNIGS